MPNHFAPRRRSKGSCLSLLICFFILSAAQPAMAQSAVHGLLVDKQSQPLPNANVLLLHARDSSLVKGVITNEKGNYTFAKAAPGQYLLAFSCTGFRPSYSAAFTLTDKQDIDLSASILQPAGQQLAALTVTATRPLFEQKMDRLVINVQNSITSAGSTALDVLERSPGVIVDRQNNAITLSGKDGVVLMIDGKINHMPMDAVIQMLGGMNSDNIEKIELITTPPANFDAEGNAGYINIVLKQNTQYGTNGSYTLSMGYGNREMPEADINFNHRKGKLNIYGDYSFSRLHSEQDWYFDHAVTNKGQLTENPTYTYRDPVQRNHDVRLGADLTLSKKTIIGALLSGYDNRWMMTAHNNGSVIVDHQIDTLLQISNDEVNHWQNYGANINLQHTFNEQEKLTLNADYIHYLDNNPNNYLNTYNDGDENFIYSQQVKSTKNTPIDFWVGAADYTHKLGKKINLETGLKTTWSTFHNNIEIDRMIQNVWTKDPSLSAKYVLSENISAAYASFSMALDPKTDLKAGLRFEHTNSNLGSDSVQNIVDRHYGDLFPSFFLTHRLNANNSLGLSYSRRITRPTFNDMAPFVIFVDPKSFFSGNPALQPSISDAVKLDWSFKKLIVSLSYSYEANPIANFSPTVDSTSNVEILSAINLDNIRTASLTIAIPVEATPWWSMSYNAIGLISKTSAVYNNSPLQFQQTNFHINSTQRFKLPKDLSLELSGFYQSPSLLGFYKTDGYGSLDLGIQKKLRDKKSTLRLSFNNIFNSMKFDLHVNNPAQNLVVTDQLQFVFRSVRLTYSHSFGNDKLKERRSRSTGSEDEEGRVQ